MSRDIVYMSDGGDLGDFPWESRHRMWRRNASNSSTPIARVPGLPLTKQPPSETSQQRSLLECLSSFPNRKSMTLLDRISESLNSTTSQLRPLCPGPRQQTNIVLDLSTQGPLNQLLQSENVRRSTKPNSPGQSERAYLDQDCARIFRRPLISSGSMPRMSNSPSHRCSLLQMRPNSPTLSGQTLSLEPWSTSIMSSQEALWSPVTTETPKSWAQSNSSSVLQELSNKSKPLAIG